MPLAILGFAWFWTEVGRVPVPFAPLITVCCQTLLLWLFSLFGGMTFAAYALLASGIGLLIWMLVRRARFSWNLVCFAAGCALLWLRYNQTPLLAYDDFSHWGLIARYMTLNGKLPDASTALIRFQSYPPASACFIAFVCRFTDASDGMMLAAQAWMSLSALWTLTVYIEGDKKGFKAFAIAAPMLAALSLFQGTASLMVDNLLASLGIGAVTIVLWGRAKPEKTFALATPVLTVLALVKDSGLFGVFLIWGLMLFLSRRKRSALIAPVAAPLAARVLWWVHLRLTFPAAETTKHAMSIENMRAMGADKSYADLFELAKQVFKQAVRADNEVLQILTLTALCLIVVLFVRRVTAGRFRFRNEVLLFAGLLTAYGLYLIALWGMYAFTLPLETARRLEAFERYNSTFALLLYGVLANVLLLALRGLSKIRLPAAAACCLALVLPFAVPSWRAGVPRLFAENYFVPMRAQMQALYAKQPLPPEQTAAVYLGGAIEDMSYAGYMARYQWMRTDIAVCRTDDVADAALGGVVYAFEVDDALRTAVSSSGRAVDIVALP